MDWFEELFGFKESEPAVRDNITVDGNKIRSKANNRIFNHGLLEVLTLEELRLRNMRNLNSGKRTTLAEVVGDVQMLHLDPKNRHALFQVASQCNLLEMVSPNVSPEVGITGYIFDRTQGPACAIAAAAGTLYRNYCVPIDFQLGQTSKLQIDTLHKLQKHLGESMWSMRNGYCLPTIEGLSRFKQLSSQIGLESCMDKVQIGVHWDTEVTLNQSLTSQRVHQAYCSAMPVSYSSLSSDEWEVLGRLVLKSAYQSTFWAAVENYKKWGCSTVYLTLLGGGAFGNPTDWIVDAINTALWQFENAGLDVKIVSYKRSQPVVQDLINNWNL